MKSKLAAAVRTAFHECMTTQLPSFQQYKTKIAGNRVYCSNVAGEYWNVIMLVIADNKEEFIVEICTNWEPMFPDIGAMRPVRESPNEIPLRFRLPRLWISDKFVPWWEIEPRLTYEESMRRMRVKDNSVTPIEELLPKVGPLVDDCFDKLIEHGMAFFRSVAAAHGHDIADTPGGQEILAESSPNAENIANATLQLAVAEKRLSEHDAKFASVNPSDEDSATSWMEEHAALQADIVEARDSMAQLREV